jgi:ABC-type amino acid transport substrate-binding protein
MLNRYFTVLIFIFLILIFTSSASARPDTSADHKNVLSRVLASGKLRCGYAPWPGLIVDVDPNTKKLTGTFYDYLQELGRSLELKIEWVAEVPFGEIPQALDSGKIDAHCSGAWTNPIRGKFVDMIVPISYQFITAFVRKGDKRFSDNFEAINDPAIKISIIDGESSSAIAATRFPKATHLSNPQGTDGVQILNGIYLYRLINLGIDSLCCAKYFIN